MVQSSETREERRRERDIKKIEEGSLKPLKGREKRAVVGKLKRRRNGGRGGERDIIIIVLLSEGQRGKWRTEEKQKGQKKSSIKLHSVLGQQNEDRRKGEKFLRVKKQLSNKFNVSSH